MTMTNISTLPSDLNARRQSVIETLTTALKDAKEQDWEWCVILGDHSTGFARRWSGYADILRVIGAIEDVKFVILSERDKQEHRL
jgi:hypothetical protein